MKTLLSWFVLGASVWAGIDEGLLARARGGDKAAQLQIARMYETGEGVDANVTRAMLWYKRAAKNDVNALAKGLASGGGSAEERPAELMRKRVEAAESYLEPLSKEEAQNSFWQIISSDFGMFPYKANDVIPVAYDFHRTDDREPAETMIQISAVIPITRNLLGLHENLAIAYTQQSWWQTFAYPKPFRETNHAPELFVTIPLLEPKWSLKAFRTGILHHSNGRDEENRVRGAGFTANSFSRIATYL